jgi:nucleoside-diphosphate-sugar epimerase
MHRQVVQYRFLCEIWVHNEALARHVLPGGAEADPTHPQSPYGVVKFAIENYLRLAADEGWLRVSALRMGNPTGRCFSPSAGKG